MLQAAGVTSCCGGKRGGFVIRCVRQRIMFQIRPDILGRIKFRSIRRKEFYTDSRMSLQKHLYSTCSVRSEAVPNNHDGRTQVPFERPEKLNHQGSPDVLVAVETEIQTKASAAGSDTQRGNRRNLFVATTALIQNGRAAAFGPTPPDQRRHHESGFVEKDKVGPQSRSLFFTRGHSFFTQSCMTSSSRSTARRVGFCGDQPRERRRRPI